eukprot:2905541-Rhodomonas_salina.2
MITSWGRWGTSSCPQGCACSRHSKQWCDPPCSMACKSVVAYRRRSASQGNRGGGAGAESVQRLVLQSNGLGEGEKGGD